MGNKATLDNKSIDTHNEVTAKSRIKILLFGSNIGKSHWFNGTREHKTIFNITFKIEAFNIGNKLPEINTVIYDTPRNIIFFTDTLKYMSYGNIPSVDGLIFTYNIHCIDSLYHLEECMDKIKQTIKKNTPCLLLGIQETKHDKKNIKNYVDDAQTFAIKHNLYHLELDLSSDIINNTNAKQPYIYLLSKIFKQKQIVSSRFNNDKYISHSYDNDKEERNGYLMPYTVRQFANANANDSHYTYYNEDEDEKYVQNEATLGINPNMETDDTNDTNDTDDTVCHDQLEFERFFKLAMGSKRSEKYFYKFKEKQYNDIRLIDPEIFDDDWFQTNEIKMDLLDEKLFKKEIRKYKNDCIQFETMLRNLNMSEKYHKQFCERGVATLWSFYYLIESSKDVEKVIGNKNDAVIIWNKLSDNHDNSHQIEGINVVPTVAPITLSGLHQLSLLNLNNVDVGNSSDSEEIYNDPN